MRRILLGLGVVALAVALVVVIRERREPDPQPEWVTCTSARVGPALEPRAPEQVDDVALERVAELPAPTAMAVLDEEQALVTTKGGTVELVALDDGATTTALDLSDDVAALENEQGLLGIAIAPDQRHVYVYFTATPDGDDTLARFDLEDTTIDPESRETLFSEPDPHQSHNGGQLAFGADGDLYVSVGDGGGSAREGDPEGDAQDRTDLYGSVLRIEPTPDAREPYAIPDDNPFVDEDGARGEVFATGLRNPWRFSFDRETGDLWLADVGHYCWEEINHVALADARGANFGWRATEGLHAYIGDDPAEDDITFPVWEYAHTTSGEASQSGGAAEGTPACSVTGGYVYRGAAIASLEGTYVYGDFCGDRLFGLRDDGGAVVPVEIAVEPGVVVSFGEDLAGELYVLSLDGVSRLVPA